MKKIIYNKKIVFFSNIHSFLLRGFLSIIFFLSANQINAQVIGDYGAFTNGNWNSPSVWKVYDGVSWATSLVSASAPNSSTANCYILSGATVTLTVSQTACNNITVNSGGKLFTNSGGSNTYLYVYGNIVCNGIIGNGATFDAISFGIEGSNCLFTGTGAVDCSRIRKNLNTIITTNLVIDININLRFGTGSQTQIYNSADGSVFNVTLNVGKTLNLTGNAGNIGNVAMDGIFGNDASERGGSYTIYGTLIISGILYITTNNTILPVTFTIEPTGIVQTASVIANNSATATHTLTMFSGGLLQITGTPFSNPFTLVNNIYNLNAGSTIEYSALGVQTVDSNLTYANLKISGSGNKTAAGPININGDLTISNSTGAAVFVPYAINPKVNVGGNWTDYGNTGFTEAGSTVTLNGNGNQNVTCTGGENFNNLSIIKTGGKVIPATVPPTLIRIAGTIDLTWGLIQTTNSSYVLIQSTGIVINVNDNSFVEGPCGRQGLTAFTFPVGKVAKYRPMSISAPPLIGTLFIAEYFKVDPQTVPFNVNSKDPTLDHISRCEYWMLRASSSTVLTITLSWDNTYSCGITSNLSISDLRVAAWNSAMWKDLGNNGTTGGVAFGTVTALTPYTFIGSNTPLTLASISALNPLPVELLSFNAQRSDENVLLDWTTASEINNDYFSIERSNDGNDFVEIARIKGTGNSTELNEYKYTDTHPLGGITYYRLRQVDFDGKYTFSDIVSFRFIGKKNFSIYAAPIPSGNKLNIFYQGQPSEFTFQLIGVDGKIFKTTKSSSVQTELDIENLVPGIYFLRVFANDEIQTIRILKN